MIENLIIKNFKKIENIELAFNDKVTRFIGLNGSGRTSILEAIHACFKGIAEKDMGGNIIGDRAYYIGPHGKTSKIQSVIVEKSGRKIIVDTTISKSGNSIAFIAEDGEVITDDYVKELLDVTLMNATQFCRLTGQDQARALGINVSQFDAKEKDLKQQFTEVNAVIRAIGNLDPVQEVQEVNVDELIKKRENLRNVLNKQYQDNVAENIKRRAAWKDANDKHRNEIQDYNDEQIFRQEAINKCEEALKVLYAYGYTGDSVIDFIDNMPKPKDSKLMEDLPDPDLVKEVPDSTELDQLLEQIDHAKDTNRMARDYSLYKTKLAQLEDNRAKLDKIKAAQSKLKDDRIKYLQDFDFGFTGLDVDEAGGLVLNGRPVATYSQAEREMIVARLAIAKNPDFRVRIIDEFNLFDEGNQEKLLKELLENNFQVLIVEVGHEKKGDNSVLLRDCKVVDDKDDTKKNLI